MIEIICERFTITGMKVTDDGLDVEVDGIDATIFGAGPVALNRISLDMDQGVIIAATFAFEDGAVYLGHQMLDQGSDDLLDFLVALKQVAYKALGMLIVEYGWNDCE